MRKCLLFAAVAILAAAPATAQTPLDNQRLDSALQVPEITQRLDDKSEGANAAPQLTGRRKLRTPGRTNGLPSNDCGPTSRRLGRC
jgi:hypothetical protein